MLDQYRDEIGPRDRMLDMVLAHDSMVFGPANNDREFYGCLCCLLCPLPSDGSGARPSTNVIGTW